MTIMIERTYRCNRPGCDQAAHTIDEGLPDGWCSYSVSMRQTLTVFFEGGFQVGHETHLCPKHTEGLNRYLSDEQFDTADDMRSRLLQGIAEIERLQRETVIQTERSRLSAKRAGLEVALDMLRAY